jgi:type IV fimbrial biogenesis protein FimT
MRPHAHSGFTLVELMIGIAVLGILVSMAMPTFQVFMQNTQIRNAADALTTGMQLARAEAIRRNKAVEFALADDSGWTVREVTSGEVIQMRAREEGSENARVETTPVGAAMLTFGSIGAPVDNEDGSASIQSVAVTSPVALDGLRPLNITISLSGSVRMCDPGSDLPADDPRRCGP